MKKERGRRRKFVCAQKSGRAGYIGWEEDFVILRGNARKQPE